MGRLFGGKKDRKNKEEELDNQPENRFEKKIVISKSNANDRVTALYVGVEKSTHKTSYINAESADINKHMGFIEGGDVRVKYLKGGKIVANTVYVDFFDSGEIEANHIHIHRLGSKNKILTTETLEIDRVEGSRNLIAIKPLIDLELFSELTKLKERINVFGKELGHIKSVFKERSLIIQEKTAKTEECKDKIAEFVKNGELPPSDLLVTVKDFDIRNKEYAKLASVISNLEENIKSNEREFLNLCNKFVFNGRVISNSLWTGGNSIIFILPEYDIDHITSKNENAHEIYLRYNANKQNPFEIEIRKKEYKK